jgi:hypothetical protein
MQAATGSLIQAATGSLIQAATGSLMQAATGSPMQAATGSLMQAAAGSLIQAVTGSLIQFATGSPPAFQSCPRYCVSTALTRMRPAGGGVGVGWGQYRVDEGRGSRGDYVHVAVLVLDTGRLPAVDSVSFEPVDMRGVPLDRCCVSVWWWWWLGGGGGGHAGPLRGVPVDRCGVEEGGEELHQIMTQGSEEGKVIMMQGSEEGNSRDGNHDASLCKGARKECKS